MALTPLTWVFHNLSDENQQLNQLRQTPSAWRASDLNAARAASDAVDLSNKKRVSLEKATP